MNQSVVKADLVIRLQPACVISQTGRCYCSSSKYPVALLFFLLIMSPAAFCMSLTTVQDWASFLHAIPEKFTHWYPHVVSVFLFLFFINKIRNVMFVRQLFHFLLLSLYRFSKSAASPSTKGPQSSHHQSAVQADVKALSPSPWSKTSCRPQA